LSKVAVSESEEKAANAQNRSDMANLEGAALNQGKTREQLREEAEHGRTERFRNHFEYIALAALWLLAGGLGVLTLIWTWHLATPDCMRWLSKEDLWTIQTIITAGAFLGIATSHFKKRMD
jgi:hypothetical protein